MIMTRFWYCFQFFHVTPLIYTKKLICQAFLSEIFQKKIKSINTMTGICAVWLSPIWWSETSMSSQMKSGLNDERCRMWMTTGIMDWLLVTREDQGIWPPLCWKIWCRSHFWRSSISPFGDTLRYWIYGSIILHLLNSLNHLFLNFSHLHLLDSWGLFWLSIDFTRHRNKSLHFRWRFLCFSLKNFSFPHAFCTTIVHFLVFLKRFSARHRSSTWCCSRLAKRRQPPSRRSRSHFSIQNSLHTNKTYRSLSARRRGISVYSVYSVDSKMLIFRTFRAFRGSNSTVWLRLDRSRLIVYYFVA